MFQIPRGTRDFTPEEMEKRRYVEEVMRGIFKKFGYREIQTPTFETLELFTAKSGQTIVDELYSFSDKGGRELALRPELTAPVIRFYVDRLQMEPKPLKMFYFGSCFRYDRPQKGRYREFTQAGCEIIGTDTNEAYAELVAMAYTLLKNVGVKNLKLKIGNLNILYSIFNKLNLPKDQQKYVIPLIDKGLFEDLFLALKDFGIKSQDANQLVKILQTTDIKAIENFIKNDAVIKKEFDELKKLTDLLEKSFKINEYQIQLNIVRGLDYYKGLVFEIEAPSLGAEKQLCGGGAYELISQFGGKESPSAGFAIGFDRTIVALESENYKFTKPQIDAYIVPLNADIIDKATEIVQNLRERGFSVDMDLLRRDVSKSLKYASSINAKKVIIIGPKEIEQNSVTIRDMKSGKQELVKIKDIFK